MFNLYVVNFITKTYIHFEKCTISFIVNIEKITSHIRNFKYVDDNFSSFLSISITGFCIEIKPIVFLKNFKN